MSDERKFQICDHDIIDAVEMIRDRKSVKGILTGFPDLDDILGGIGRGELVVVGGRPAMGKTAFALSILINTSIREGKEALYLTAEDSKTRLVERLIRMMGRIDPFYYPDNEEEYVDKVKMAADEVRKASIHIDDYSPVSIESVERIITECDRIPRLVVVDYLQLISVEGREPGHDRIEESICGLKEIGKRYGCAILVLSQLSRRVEARNYHRPMLSDFRGSGAIEEVADKILLLYRDEYYNIDTDLRGIGEVIVAKNLGGRIGTAQLVFLPEYTRFFPLERGKKVEY